MSNIIYPQGRAEVTVPPGEKIAVYTKGEATVSQVNTYANYPSSTVFLGLVKNQETVFGAYASGATIVIDSGDSAIVLYSVGVSPICTERLISPSQVTPSAKTVAVTLTAAELLTGIITGTHTAGATAAYTLPTGANVDLAAEFGVDESFEWTLINLSAAALDSITVTANTGHTLVGGALVQSAHATTGFLHGSSGSFRTRKTAADTFVTYRIA